jgi:hypothetical protein
MTAVAAATALMSPVAAAQGSVTVSTHATITGAFTVETRRIDFGHVVAGVAQTVAAAPGGANGRAGEVILSFENESVAVSIPAEMILSGAGGQIRATLTCARSQRSQGSTMVPFPCAEGATFAPDPDGRSERTVYVGGVLPASETRDRAAGIYSGAVVITATRITT